MLTVAQLIALETGNSLPPLRGHDLLKKFPAKALSLRSLISAVGKQTLGYYVDLRSLTLLQQASSFADLQARWKAGEGKINGEDISAFRDNVLQPRNVTLKLVTSDSRALIVGTVAALVTVPTVPITSENLEDVQTGVSNIGGGLGIFGGILVAVALAPTPVEPLAVVALIAGAAIAGAGGGALFGTGLGQILDSTQPTSTDSDSTQPTSTDGGTSSVDQTDVPQPEGDSVSVPDAEIFGALPDGVDPEQLAEAIANDLILVPDGFDLGTGAGLPNIPGLGDGSGNFGDGNGGEIPSPGGGFGLSSGAG